MPIRLLLLGLGAALSLLTVLIARAERGFSVALTTPHGLIALLGAGWTLLIGAFALGSRPSGRRAGILLFIAAYAWFLPEWDNPGTTSSVAFSLGLALNAACPAAVGHLALAYPGGRLGSWPARVLVVGGYAITVGVQGVGAAAYSRPQAHGCPQCPRNWWALADAPARAQSIASLGVQAGTVWLSALIAFLAWRLLTSSPAARRSTGLPTLCTLGYITAVALSYVRSLDRGFLGFDARDGQLWLTQAGTLSLLAAAALADLVRIRLRRRELTRVVIDIGATATPGRLRDAIAERLDDPDLQIAYPVGVGHRHIDASGSPVAWPPQPGRATTTLRISDAPLSILIHRPGLLDSPMAVDELVSGIHMALEHERLHAESQAQLADLRASGARIITAGDEERRRLERDLHDGAQQRLVGLALGLRLLRIRTTTPAPHLDRAEAELEQAITDLRAVARGLYPVLLKEAGLAVALEALAHTRDLRIQDVPRARYPDVLESTVYLMVARMSENRTTTVGIDECSRQLITSVTVTGEMPDLADLTDRITTLEGALTSHTEHGSTQAILQLPLPCPDQTAVAHS
ncbi:histidine kinase [Streptomyces sp. TLI_185]|uniref:histidine kinase n=1 Tax=Streptomyces sp. TLI_185 TaxID=2485151 RepID=UPI000F99F15E|nr:histidine kinase [Streptomyces sp. TLI_185]RPF39174.1 histidine kinase [Streptomyces sp. TLI_185]